MEKKDNKKKSTTKVATKTKRKAIRTGIGKDSSSIKGKAMYKDIKKEIEKDIKKDIKKESGNADKRKKVILDLLSDELYVPMKEKELAIMLQVSKEDRAQLQNLLEELLNDGKIMLTNKQCYIKTKTGRKNVSDKVSDKVSANVSINANYKTSIPVSHKEGIFTAHAKGFGFVTVEGMEEDLFIPEDRINGAFHQDRVLVTLIEEKSGKRQEAEVIKVLERGIEQVVGTFEKAKNFGFVIPDNLRFTQDIFIPKEYINGAVDGHKVIVKITDYGSVQKSPEGKVLEILGHMNDPGVDILSIVKNFNIPTEFPEKVMNQASRVGDEVSEADRTGRKDLRDILMVTIDGEDAKDLDDAVNVSFDGEFYHLGVHIADVTNYVQENSALDREALERGTSVYLVDRVIPMLPHALSNGICSLNQGVDRLALSCQMIFDKEGTVKDYEICESVINVKQRMSYTAVKNILIDETFIEYNSEYAIYKNFVPMFKDMEKLAEILRKKRSTRGAIDFDFPECKIVLDKTGHPIEIKPYERNVATRIIEEFMLAANETIAQHFYWLELPFVYRVHDNPDTDRIQKLSTFINNYGYFVKTIGQSGKKTKKNNIHPANGNSSDGIHPKEIQKLLESIAGTAEEAMISRLVLRSMKKANYSVDNAGHFGLACQYYCHFTSPIRRYPDLQIHRIIKEQIRGKLKEKRIEHYNALLPQVAKHSSDTERRADEAERETDKLKKVEYMESHLFELFEGVVSGVTTWGIYVELDNTVEGLVHVSKLPGDYFVYREESNEMLGEKTNKSYKLGMPVKVRAVGTDRIMKTIDFEIIIEAEEDEI